MAVPRIPESRLSKTASVLKAVAHPTRIKIVCLLGSKKRMSVSDISTKTDCEQSLVSHHLTGMKSKGIVTVERNGKNIYYSLADKKLLGILKCINDCKNL